MTTIDGACPDRRQPQSSGGCSPAAYALTGWQVRCDLRDYSQAIRHSECGIAEKEHLLDQVERIDDDLRRGRCIGWLRWRETDQVIRELLQGGLNSKKARLAIREFRCLEMELNQ